MKNNILPKIMMMVAIMFAGYACDTDYLTDLDNPKYLLTPDNADMSMLFTNILISHGRGSTGSNPVRIEGGYCKYYATYSNLMQMGGLYVFDQGLNDSPWGVYTGALKMATSLKTTPAKLAYTWGGSSDSKKARDIVYGGTTAASATSVGNWRKYAYSLMLRLAMRASGADAAMAKTYAEKAIAGGVITINSENWTLKTKTGMNSELNPYSSFFEGSPSGDPERYMKLGEYFVNFLKTNNDPRQKVYFGGRLNNTITAITASDMQGYWRDATKWNWDLTGATGMIHGTNAMPTPTIAVYHQTYTSPNPYLYTLDAPLVIMTAAEMHYLIAEAALNGWATGGVSADQAYANAITANMTQLSAFTGLMASQKISGSEITDYITAKPLGTGASARQRLAEEIWVSLHMNPSEAWFNVRRMDLNLPSNIPTTPTPKRFAYVENERSNNLANLESAITDQGWTTTFTRDVEIAQKVWWDVN